MLLWQRLIEESGCHAIANSSREARAWVREQLPWLVRSEEELFNWRKEWPAWEKNFAALIWLADARKKAPNAGSKADRMPSWVSQPVDGVLDGIRWTLKTDFLSDGLRPRLTRSDGDSAADYELYGRFDDLTVFWQAIFLSYFHPSLLPGASICEFCGGAIPPTKSGKASKARVCSPECRMSKWRNDNPDKAREYDREAKRAERRRNQSAA